MIKKIREEKTFKEGLKKGGIHEALGDLNSNMQIATVDRKYELEDIWIKELIQRKKEEISRLEEIKESAGVSLDDRNYRTQQQQHQAPQDPEIQDLSLYHSVGTTEKVKAKIEQP